MFDLSKAFEAVRVDLLKLQTALKQEAPEITQATNLLSVILIDLTEAKRALHLQEVYLRSVAVALTEASKVGV